MKRGRPSAAHLSVVPSDLTGARPTLTPLQPLKADEKQVFDLAVRENAHLRPTDIPLLMGFARASAGLFKVDTAADFEKLARVTMSLAAKLRISLQSRHDPKTLARRYADAHTGPKPWDRNRDGNDNDEDK